MNTSQKTTAAPRAPQLTRESFDDRTTLELRRWLEAIERARSPVLRDRHPEVELPDGSVVSTR